MLASLCLAAIYLAVMNGHNTSSDGLLIYRQGLALAHGSLHFPKPIFWGANYLTSKYGIGLSLLYVPGVTLASWLGYVPAPAHPGTYSWGLLYADPVYAIGAAPVNAFVTAVTGYLVARFVTDLGFERPTAVFALAAFGIASPALVYARSDFAQPLLGLCLISALLAGFRYRRSSTPGALVVAGASLCLGVLSRPVEGSFLLPALLSLIVPISRPRQWTPTTRRGVAVVLGSYLIAVIITLLINWGRYGSPLLTGYSAEGWTTPLWIGLPGILASPGRSILLSFPLAFLAPLGLRRLWLSDQGLVAAVFAGLVTLLLLNSALWSPWWGGWDWGSRLFVPAFPVLAILAAIAASSLRRRLRIWLPALLFLGGVAWAVPGTVTDLLGGYAATYDGGRQSFQLSAYPPIGGWAFLKHARSYSLMDSSGLDIVWLRVARVTNNASLMAPAILLGLAMAMAIAAARILVTPVRRRTEWRRMEQDEQQTSAINGSESTRPTDAS